MPERIIFTKSGRARYISHLDLMRTFQRAFLRAGLHIRHTEGFNPHAFVSIPLPLSVGFSSDCEIMEFGLPKGLAPDDVPARMTAVLPEGIAVTRCYCAQRPFRALAFVEYIITLEYDAGTPAGAETAIRALLARESLVVEKKSKKAKTGVVEVDLIPLIARVSYESRRDALVLSAILKAQDPGLNPALLVKCIEAQCPEVAPDYVSYHRKQVLDADLAPYA